MPSPSQPDLDRSGPGNPTMIRAIPPPPGVTSNFVNPANCSRHLVVTGSVLAGIMVVFIAARAYTKTFITRKFFWDDCPFPLTPFSSKDLLMFIVTCAFAAVRLLINFKHFFLMRVECRLERLYITPMLLPVCYLAIILEVKIDLAFKQWEEF